MTLALWAQSDQQGASDSPASKAPLVRLDLQGRAGGWDQWVAPVHRDPWDLKDAADRGFKGHEDPRALPDPWGHMGLQGPRGSKDHRGPKGQPDRPASVRGALAVKGVHKGLAARLDLKVYRVKGGNRAQPASRGHLVSKG